MLPEYQNKKVGRALLSACWSYLSACQVCGLETSPKSEKNMHFYSSSGYAAGASILVADKLVASDNQYRAEEIKSPTDFDSSELCNKVYPALICQRRLKLPWQVWAMYTLQNTALLFSIPSAAGTMHIMPPLRL